MARDIAFVAEKDTPEGAGTPLEPGPSLTGGPGPEGTPAGRELGEGPSTPAAPSSAPPDRPPDAASPPGPPADEHAPEPALARLPPETDEPPAAAPAPPAEAPSRTESESPAEPGPGEAPHPKSETPRTDAVETARADSAPIAEPPVAAPPLEAPAPEEPGLPEPQPPAPPADAPPSGPDAEQAPAPDLPSQPTGGEAPASSAEDASSASFTSAAEGLFRPPEVDADDDTHLITTGRRFSPKLAIPEPAPPVAEAETPDPPAPASPWKRRLWTGARYAAYAVAGYLLLVLVLIVLFRFVNPPGSMLMLTKLLGGTAIDRTWVPFEAISPALARAVIVSEDSRFCAHRGIDMQAMRLALEEASRGAPRGASTISMQVTKNLFLWNAKSYLRKVIEIPLTLVMEVIWPKARIIEVYLNIAEWGPGVFGAEAAARHHFDKPASKLTEREAALLAAALPNPMIRVASNPGPRTSRMARVIQARVKAFGSVARCVVAPAPPAAPAVARPRAPAAKAPARNATPAKKAPAKKPQQKQEAQDWAPTLRFGP